MTRNIDTTHYPRHWYANIVLGMQWVERNWDNLNDAQRMKAACKIGDMHSKIRATVDNLRVKEAAR